MSLGVASSVPQLSVEGRVAWVGSAGDAPDGTDERLDTAHPGADRALTEELDDADLAETAEPQLVGADQAAGLKRLAAEQANLNAALKWAQAANENLIGLRLSAALWRLLVRSVPFHA